MTDKRKPFSERRKGERRKPIDRSSVDAILGTPGRRRGLDRRKQAERPASGSTPLKPCLSCGKPPATDENGNQIAALCQDCWREGAKKGNENWRARLREIREAEAREDFAEGSTGSVTSSAGSIQSAHENELVLGPADTAGESADSKSGLSSETLTAAQCETGADIDHVTVCAAPEASPSPQANTTINTTATSRAESFRDLLIDTVMVLRFIIGQPPYKRGIGEYAGNDYCSWCATRKDLPHSKSCLRQIAIDVTNEWSALQ